MSCKGMVDSSLVCLCNLVEVKPDLRCHAVVKLPVLSTGGGKVVSSSTSQCQRSSDSLSQGQRSRSRVLQGRSFRLKGGHLISSIANGHWWIIHGFWYRLMTTKLRYRVIINLVKKITNRLRVNYVLWNASGFHQMVINFRCYYCVELRIA